MRTPFGLLTLAIVIVFGPNFIHLAEGTFGATGSDALKHVWSQWFVVQQLASDGSLSLETSLVHHPAGGAFFSLDTFNAFIGLPFRIAFGPVMTFNLVLMINLTLAAFGGALLARRFIDDDWACALGGFGFAFSAWVLAFPVASGVSETAVFWPVPLIILLALKSWTSSDWWPPALAGVLLSIQGFACWSHGITVGLLLIGLFIFSLAQNPMAWKEDGRPKRIGLFLATALLLVIPGYLAISGTVSADDAIKTRSLSLFHSAPIGPLDALETNNMALVDFFAIGPWGLRNATMGTDRLMYAANPGLILLGLAIVAWKQQRSRVRLLTIGAVLMLLLSLGPRIYFDHARTIGGIPNPVYLFAYWAIPLVNATIHSVDRFAVGFQLCVAIMASIGMTVVAARWRPWLLIGVVLELILVSPGPWPIPMTEAKEHPASIAIQNSDHQNAVIDIPFMEGDENHRWFLGDVFLQQTVHSRPIPFQLEGHALETVHSSVRANSFFEKFAAAAIDGRPIAPGCEGLKGLTEMGFGWVVWRPMLTPDAVREEFGLRMASCLPNSTDFGDRILYQIPASP